MSGDAVGIFGKACRLFSCLTGANEHPAGAGAHGNGTSPKAPGQPAGHPRSNSYAATSPGAAMTAALRHNPIDVCLTSGEVSVLQGNPSQRTFEASWCGLPVHLHVLTFTKRPNPIAQLPGPTSSHATVAAALDTPPPAQANMLTQPDMIAVATEVEAALVQLIAEPTPQVLPVLACAKVTCRAHIGSPGDEHVTQRIVAEVHIVTPRVPGLVSLSQWLQQRWPQCELNTSAATTTTTTTDNNNNNNNNGGAGGAAGGATGAGAAAAPPAPSAPAAPNHRLASASSPTSGVPGAVAPGGPTHSTAATVAAAGPGRGQAPGLTSVPGPMASRLGVSQPIAEGVAPRDIDARGESGSGSVTTAMATARASGAETDGSEGGAPACIPCLALFFAPSPATPPPPPPSAAGPGVVPGVASGGGGPAPGQQQQQPPPAAPANPGRTGQGAAAAARSVAGAAAGAPAAAPAATGDTGNGTRRLAAPAPTGLGLGRAPRVPLPPPPPQLPKLPLPEALELLICLAEALRNLHRRGLTHGSLTPKTIQLQLVEPEAAATAATAVAASATAAVAATAAGPAAAGQLPVTQGSPQTSCPSTQPPPSSPLPATPSPQSQSRTPDHAPGQRQEQQAGESPERAGNPSPGSLHSAAVDSAAVSALPSAGADTGKGAAASCTPGSPVAAAPASSAVVSDAAAAAAPAAVTGAAERSQQPGAPDQAADGAAPGAVAPPKATEAASAATDGPAPAAASESGARGTAAATDGAEAAVSAPPSSGKAPEASASPAAAAAAAAADKVQSTIDGTAAAAAAASGADAALQQPVAPAPSTPQQQQRVKSVQPARRRAAGAGGGTIRAVLPLPAVGPALLQMQTWGRARPVGLPRDHLLWCAPELLNAGGLGWGPPLLARRSGNGSATVAGSMGLTGLGPLDQSIGCRGGNRMGRGGNHHHHHHNRHFGDGSYGGSIGVGGGGGNSRRYRLATSLLMGQDPGAAGSNANGITPSCDVYSLGMLMWYLVSGQSPFQHLPNQDVLRVKEMGSLDEQLPFSTEMPSGYVQLARRCWAPLPMQRPTMNVVLSEMRSLRAQLLGLPGQRELAGIGASPEHGHGYGYGGSSMGEMTGDSRLSFTLSLPLSSRDLSNGEEYSLARPPLELAFGAGDASGASGAAGGAGGAAAAAGVSTGGSGHAPPPPLKASLPAALLTALTAPRRGSAGGGGGGLMDDDDNYSDTDRFTEAHTTEHTEVSGGTLYSSPPTAGTTRGASVGGASARLRTAAAAAAFASTARSFRLVRGGHRPGSTASSIGRSGGSIPTALLAANGSRRGGVSVHSPGAWGGVDDGGNSPLVGTQPHAPAGRVPSVLAAAASSLRGRCGSSSSLVGMGATPPPPSASALAALRFSHTPGSGGGGGGSRCPGGSIVTAGDSRCSSTGSPGGGGAAAAAATATGATPGSSTGGGCAAAAAASSSGRVSGLISATSASISCLAVPCGNGSAGSDD
ncbi:hypothetical protein PLESTM_000019900 [Pleodorina starrii]|nr:hypothetical protein PLESTM_000019900 [Pleodorina starrii]